MSLKIYILSVLLMVLPIVASSQVEVYNLTLEDSTSKVLIKNIENIIVVEGFTDHGKLVLESTSSKVARNMPEENIFYLNVNSLTSTTDTLSVWYNGKLVGESIFSIESVSRLYAYFDEIIDTVASVDEILNLQNPQLKAKFPELELNIGLRIFEFKTIFLNNNSDTLAIVPAILNNSFLTQEHLSIIEQLNAGDKIIFEPVAVASGVASTRLPPFVITIE